MSTAKSEKTELGSQGEALVAEWLQSQGWTILERQWHCRWGELDLIVVRQQGRETLLAFVEVKTRSRGNWDADGLMAITPGKQSKLWQAARLYLAQHSQWAEACCRFDVALVACHPTLGSGHPAKTTYQLSDRRWLVLQDYLENAFQR